MRVPSSALELLNFVIRAVHAREIHMHDCSTPILRCSHVCSLLMKYRNITWTWISVRVKKVEIFRTLLKVELKNSYRFFVTLKKEIVRSLSHEQVKEGPSWYPFIGKASSKRKHFIHFWLPQIGSWIIHTHASGNLLLIIISWCCRTFSKRSLQALFFQQNKASSMRKQDEKILLKCVETLFFRVKGEPRRNFEIRSEPHYSLPPGTVNARGVSREASSNSLCVSASLNTHPRRHAYVS